MKKYLNEKREIKIFYPILSFPWHIAFFWPHAGLHNVRMSHKMALRWRRALSTSQRLVFAEAKTSECLCERYLKRRRNMRYQYRLQVNTATHLVFFARYRHIVCDEKNVIVHFTCFYARQNLAILTLHYSHYILSSEHMQEGSVGK